MFALTQSLVEQRITYSGYRLAWALHSRFETGCEGLRPVRYHRVPGDWRKEQKLAWLASHAKASLVNWAEITPDSRQTWLVAENADEFSGYLPVGSKEVRSSKKIGAEAIFKRTPLA